MAERLDVLGPQKRGLTLSLKTFQSFKGHSLRPVLSTRLRARTRPSQKFPAAVMRTLINTQLQLGDTNAWPCEPFSTVFLRFRERKHSMMG